MVYFVIMIVTAPLLSLTKKKVSTSAPPLQRVTSAVETVGEDSLSLIRKSSESDILWTNLNLSYFYRNYIVIGVTSFNLGCNSLTDDGGY